MMRVFRWYMFADPEYRNFLPANSLIRFELDRSNVTGWREDAPLLIPEAEFESFKRYFGTKGEKRLEHILLVYEHKIKRAPYAN